MAAKLIQVTDPHLVAPDGRVHGLDPRERLKACLDHVAANHADADLCVISGDLSDTGQPESYGVLRTLLDGFPLPVRLMLGNHDGRAAFRAAFPDQPVDRDGFVQSVADLGADPDGERLVFLDTLDEGHLHGRLCDRRLAWLSARLDEAAGRPVSLFAHHPPLAARLPRLAPMMLVDTAPLMELLCRHGRVRHLFLGHLHMAMSGTIDGIGFTIGRGTCHQTLPALDDPPATFVDGAPSYTIALYDDADLIVHEVEVPGRGPVIAVAGQPARR